jgi:hypothetical protein
LRGVGSRRLYPGTAVEGCTRIQPGADVLADCKTLESVGCGAQMRSVCLHHRLRQLQRESPTLYSALVACHSGNRLLVRLQVRAHIPVDGQCGGRRDRERRTAWRTSHGVHVARDTVGRRGAPRALVHDGEERGLRCDIPGPECGGDHQHVRLKERGHRGGAPCSPGGKGGEAIGGGCAGEPCSGDVGHAQRVVRVECCSVVGRTPLSSLPLVEIRNVGRRRGCRDPLQYAEFPTGRQGRESSRLRRSGAIRHGAQRAKAYTSCCQGEDERQVAEDACHELSIGRWLTRPTDGRGRVFCAKRPDGRF